MFLMMFKTAIDISIERSKAVSLLQLDCLIVHYCNCVCLILACLFLILFCLGKDVIRDCGVSLVTPFTYIYIYIYMYLWNTNLKGRLWKQKHITDRKWESRFC